MELSDVLYLFEITNKFKVVFDVKWKNISFGCKGH